MYLTCNVESLDLHQTSLLGVLSINDGRCLFKFACCEMLFNEALTRLAIHRGEALLTLGVGCGV